MFRAILSSFCTVARIFVVLLKSKALSTVRNVEVSIDESDSIEEKGADECVSSLYKFYFTKLPAMSFVILSLRHLSETKSSKRARFASRYYVPYYYNFRCYIFVLLPLLLLLWLCIVSYTSFFCKFCCCYCCCLLDKTCSKLVCNTFICDKRSITAAETRWSVLHERCSQRVCKVQIACANAFTTKVGIWVY